MSLAGRRTYVGFGFGPIQAGLFLYEAFVSGHFGQLVVAEVLPEVVAAVRQSGGHYHVNVAHADRVEHVRIGPIRIQDPALEADRERLIEAVAGAQEIGTAVPSVSHYTSVGAGSIHRILAEGLRRKAARGGPCAVVYAAENHNHAAEILEASVLDEVPEGERDSVQSQVRYLNTVIGKMSGTVSDPAEVGARGLMIITEGQERAFLVEVFNSILISEIRFQEAETAVPFRRGIEVLEEKEDLLPFEEAKLYGHNATHALAAYMGAVAGVEHVAGLEGLPGTIDFLRDALVEESGTALVRKYGGVDELFTPEGYRCYADDLLARMVNPYLGDTVARVGRDPGRKLGWDDRLIGTMRMALQQGVEPHRYAFGAAAALAAITPAALEPDASIDRLLLSLWQDVSPATLASEADGILSRVEHGRRRLIEWHASGFDRRQLEPSHWTSV